MDDLDKISGLFEEVKKLKETILTNFNVINTNIESLQNIYKEVSEKHKERECTLGVDSLYFQNSLIRREYDSLTQLSTFINNRIYCEYYKLHKMIVNYITNILISQELINKTKSETVFPAYKSLDPLKVYDSSLVNQLFSHIIDLLTKMTLHIKSQDEDLILDKHRMEMGLNIDNVIHSQSYMNSMLREKILMYTNYLSTFQRHHTKYLMRLSSKVDLVLSIINSDITLRPTKKTFPVNDAAPNVEPDAAPNVEPDAAPNVAPNVEPDAAPKENTENTENTEKIVEGEVQTAENNTDNIKSIIIELENNDTTNIQSEEDIILDAKYETNSITKDSINEDDNNNIVNSGDLVKFEKQN